jgi:spore coat-associated protein N
MNTRVLTSVLTIVAVVAAVSAMTYAFFSDSGTSNDNIFSAGTLDLKLSDDTPETDQDNVTASFGGSNMAPGGCTTTQQLRAKNTGNVAGNHIEIAATNTITDSAPAGSPAIDRLLVLDLFEYDGSNIPVSDFNSNGLKDLDDLENVGVDNLALTDLNTNHTIDIRVCLHSSADNTHQGDSVDSDWTITLNQDASQ